MSFSFMDKKQSENRNSNVEGVKPATPKPQPYGQAQSAQQNQWGQQGQQVQQGQQTQQGQQMQQVQLKQEKQGKLKLDTTRDDFSDFEGLIEKGIVKVPDLIAPSAVDVTNYDYIIVDGMYITTMIIVTYPYQRTAGWLTDLINHGEGVEVNLYYEPIDKAKIIKELTYMIGTTSVKRRNIGDNQSDVDVIDTSIGHARYMRQQMQTESEDPYYLYLLISVYAEDRAQLEDRLRSVESRLDSMDIISRRADYRNDMGFKACLPMCQITPELKKSSARNSLTTGLATTYPFVSSEFCDNDGIFIGVNEHNHSMVIVDIFNTALYKNANMVVLGTSGAGKTFLIQLIALRNRLQGINVMLIAPLKGHEFRRSCESIGGQFIRISPASTDCINIMEVRKASIEMDLHDDDFDNQKDALKSKNTSLLLSKIQKLHIFFSLVFPDMTIEERQYLDDKLIEVFRLKGITFDNESLYSDEIDRMSNERKFKMMPVLGDLYELLAKDHNTTRMALLIKRLVTGSLQLFNQQTNIDLTNKFTVADISELKEEILPLGMFITIDFFWDKIKEDRTLKKVIIVDELWNLIGSSGNKQTAQFIMEIFKIIRGYGGSAIGATQDINDFFALEGGKYGKGIINNSKMKIVLQLEEEDAEVLRRVLKLSDEEVAKVTTFKRGHGLFYAGANHIAIEFKASAEEKDLITTDRAELEELKRRRKFSKMQDKYSDDELEDF